MTWIKQKDKIDGAMKAKVYSFFEKLQKDDTSPGLHIEPMQNPADPRVRTGRIDQKFRAVLFKVFLDTIPHYFYYGAWPHDQAIEIARSSVLNVNSANGVLEVLRKSAPANTAEPARAKTPPVPPKPEIESAPVTVPAEVWVNPLAQSGTEAADLVSRLGLDEELVQAAYAAPSDDRLIDLLGDAPDWQATALLELAAGMSMAEVEDKLALNQFVVDPQATEEEKIKQALEHPATKMQFTFIGEDSEELRRVIEGGDFDAWRTFLHPEQRIYAERHYNGSFRLSGGAGTGKTVVLLHRARMLAKSEPSSRVVLTTYTTTLAESLNNGLSRLDNELRRAEKPGESGVLIAGVDSLVSRVLHPATDAEKRQAMKGLFGMELPAPSNLIGTDPSAKQWEYALASVDHGLEPELANATFLQQEYETVVLPNLITAKDDYLKIPRAGRGTALNRAKRLAVWKLIEEYRYHNRIEMHATYVEMAHLAACVLRQRGDGNRVADHVLIDEAQDLHAGHWLFLRELVKKGPDDLFIAEDSHQRIYGQKVPLSRFGIGIVGRSRRLTLNYRTTQQNLAYAVGLLKGAPVTDIEGEQESVSGYTSSRVGPTPLEQAAPTSVAELDNLAATLKTWQEDRVDLGNVGILVRYNNQVAKVISGLDERGMRARNVDASDPAGAPMVMTMHRSKGMEFTRVVLYGLSADSLPASYKKLAPAEQADALLRERSLLYVAATRARDGLVVSWSGKPLELLGAV
ncbi:AAA family ATPase [Arthrobacter sp. zg-Y859]|uniref:DNA 3'-5' helicase n=1 Tax=Arthrobacter jinronghuae TaxID=2964609 RepID=A0ABT1NUN7_9MICC|nr:3'-5' exonuclease [Arthrobacter jinronghuae]MCQ1950817.1 AAA family ATPase [Arthrobacter jinronghuae]UWX79285.1 AAA family ATPase [Arthrobacter jinronghuae]